VKVLQINRHHFPNFGADQYYMGLSRLLEERGHHVSHLAMLHAETVDSPTRRFFVEDISFYDPSLLRRARAAVRLLWSFPARRAVRRLLAAGRPDVAHYHCIFRKLTPSILPALKERGIPVVQTVHEMQLVCGTLYHFRAGRICEECRGGRHWRLLATRCRDGSAVHSALLTLEMYLHRAMRVYERFCDRFICPSRFLLERLAERGIPRRKLVHVPLFVDETFFTPGAAPKDSRAPFLYVGQLEPHKGIDVAIEAVARVPGARLRIVGRGPRADEIAAHAARAAPGRIELLGWRDRSGVREEMRGARALLVPSLWYENSPLVILEAAGCGTPAVVSDVGALPELVAEGETGLRFRVGDAAALAARVERLAGDDALARRLGEAARARVERDHARAVHVERILSIYEGLLARRARAGPR
jgi:glycosyltransferase involved in cell wall biosynthesis